MDELPSAGRLHATGSSLFGTNALLGPRLDGGLVDVSFGGT